MEKYIQIKEFENYEVSNLGNIRNIKTGRILKQHLTSSRKYYQLNLINNKGKKHKMLTHRLVATAHLENPDNLPEVDHKDRNKLNNISDNLRWVTKKENLENSMLGKTPFITFNNTNNLYIVYNPSYHQYINCDSITDAVNKFQSLID